MVLKIVRGIFMDNCKCKFTKFIVITRALTGMVLDLDEVMSRCGKSIAKMLLHFSLTVVVWVVKSNLSSRMIPNTFISFTIFSPIQGL